MRVSAIDDPAHERADLRFGLSSDFDGSRATLRPHGEVDIATAPAIEQHARSLWDEGVEELVLDLGSVTFFDSSGLRLLIRLQTEAEEHERRALMLDDCSPAVTRVLELTRLTGRFQTAG